MDVNGKILKDSRGNEYRVRVHTNRINIGNFEGGGSLPGLTEIWVEDRYGQRHDGNVIEGGGFQLLMSGEVLR